MTLCPKCSANVHDDKANCDVCGAFVGHPNVRAAEAERADLDARYHREMNTAAAKGAGATVLRFEQAVTASHAVINVDLRYLEGFLSDPKALYSNYWQLTDGEARHYAEPAFDRERRSIDTRLFGPYAKDIRVAALSIDGQGLISYGPYSVRLKEVAVAERANLLEENPFHFVKKHDVDRTNVIPPGCRAIWSERAKLAVAKLAPRIAGTTPDADFASILLSSKGDRATDEFMEVEIFGPFDQRVIAGVKGPEAPKARLEKAQLAKVKERLRKIGATWDGE